MCDQFCKTPGQPGFQSAWERATEPTPLMEPNMGPHHCTRRHAPRRSMDYHYSVEPVAFDGRRDGAHHTLAVLTAERPKDSLAGMTDSLSRAGIGGWAGPRLLVSDGRHEDLPWNWTSIVHPHRRGSAAGFVSVLRHALANDPDLDYLTFFEDDISLCRNALTYMAGVVIPQDLAFLSWFTYDYDYASPPHTRQVPHPSELKNPVLGVRPARFFILIQACTFPRRTIERLLRCPKITCHWPKREGHDEMVAWALGDSLYGTHFPIIVQHTGGLNSAVVLDRGQAKLAPDDPWAAERRSPYYLGDDFDVRSLSCGF